jgi:hypothetical protein
MHLKSKLYLGLVVYAYNPTTWGAKARGSQVQGQLRLPRKSLPQKKQKKRKEKKNQIKQQQTILHTHTHNPKYKPKYTAHDSCIWLLPSLKNHWLFFTMVDFYIQNMCVPFFT